MVKFRLNRASDRLNLTALHRRQPSLKNSDGGDGGDQLQRHRGGMHHNHRAMLLLSMPAVKMAWREDPKPPGTHGHLLISIEKNAATALDHRVKLPVGPRVL